MADNESALRQEQIDAILAGGRPIKQSATPGEPEEPTVHVTPVTIDEVRAREASTTAAPGPKPAPGSYALQATVSQLAERLAQLEAAMSQTRQMHEQFQSLMSQLQEVSSRVESMMGSLQGTVGFGARQSFVCRSCHSQGYVAARLNCTVCNEENWWGWWPPQQQ